jgi:hypothetical protein
MQRLARRLHYTLSALAGGFLVMWAVTGFAFTCFDFQAVRGARDRAASALLGPDAVAAVPALARLGVPIRSAKLSSFLGEPLLVVEPEAGPTLVVDAVTGAPRRAFDESDAARLATAMHVEHPAVLAVERIEREGQEAWVDPPAFRVRLADARGTEVFVSAKSGEILAWRNVWWRRFDALFSLHTFGFVSRESPAQWPLRLAGFVALLACASGVHVLFFRLRATLAARRRRTIVSAPSSARAPS